MVVERLRLRRFRSYEQAELDLGAGITVITGPNGAGKTNLLEALYFGCTGRSCRTTNDREVVRFGEASARVEVTVRNGVEDHTLAVGFAPGQPKHLAVDGDDVERLHGHPLRPLMTVFLPDRLELVKGSPAVRRGHLDQFVAALWPSRSLTRREYGRALAQRNALLMRVRDRGTGTGGLDAWEHRLAELGVALIADRRRAIDLIADRAPAVADDLGLPHGLEVRLRSADDGLSVDDVRERLERQRDSDLRRGFTQSGPHRDDVGLRHGGRELRAYGSQGQQRLGLLALQLSEREALSDEHGRPPLLLLDDVMSELDADRRRLLVERIGTGGQALLTATEVDHVPVPDTTAVAQRQVAASGEITAWSELGA